MNIVEHSRTGKSKVDPIRSTRTDRLVNVVLILIPILIVSTILIFTFIAVLIHYSCLYRYWHQRHAIDLVIHAWWHIYHVMYIVIVCQYSWQYQLALHLKVHFS